MLLLELDVRHGLYEAVRVENAQQAPAGRASRRTVEQVMAAAELPIYVAVPFHASHLESAQLLEHVRAALRTHGSDDTLLATLSTPDGLWITGMAPAVAALLTELQAADQASGAGSGR